MDKRLIIGGVICAVVLLIFFLFIAAKADQEKEEEREMEEKEQKSQPPETKTVIEGQILKGIGFWPTNIEPEYLDAWFAMIKDVSDILVIQKGDMFDDLKTDQNYNTFVLDAWFDRAGGKYKKYVGLEPFSGDRKQLDTPPGWTGRNPPLIFDEAWQEKYLEVVMRNVQRHKPDYLNPCVEVNMWYGFVSPEEWEAFRELYVRMYDQVKAVSSHTKVFCSLQYELLSGKIFYGSDAQWELLDDPEKALPKQDFFGVSSYPFGDPVEKTWYDGLRERELPPIFIAETGFIGSDPKYPMYLAEQEKQKKYIEQLPRLYEDLDINTVLWITLADPDPKVAKFPEELEWISVQGLVHTDLEPKLGFEAWKQLF